MPWFKTIFKFKTQNFHQSGHPKKNITKTVCIHKKYFSQTHPEERMKEISE
jgi:hypothetical protein